LASTSKRPSFARLVCPSATHHFCLPVALQVSCKKEAVRNRHVSSFRGSADSSQRFGNSLTLAPTCFWRSTGAILRILMGPISEYLWGQSANTYGANQRIPMGPISEYLWGQSANTHRANQRILKFPPQAHRPATASKSTERNFAACETRQVKPAFLVLYFMSGFVRSEFLRVVLASRVPTVSKY